MKIEATAHPGVFVEETMRNPGYQAYQIPALGICNRANYRRAGQVFYETHGLDDVFMEAARGPHRQREYVYANRWRNRDCAGLPCSI